MSQRCWERQQRYYGDGPIKNSYTCEVNPWTKKEDKMRIDWEKEFKAIDKEFRTFECSPTVLDVELGKLAALRKIAESLDEIEEQLKHGQTDVMVFKP